MSNNAEKTYTQARFDDVVGSDDAFDITLRCRKCGSTECDLRYNPGMVYSEYTSESSCFEVWCTKCNSMVSAG